MLRTMTQHESVTHVLKILKINHQEVGSSVLSVAVKDQRHTDQRQFWEKGFVWPTLQDIALY